MKVIKYKIKSEWRGDIKQDSLETDIGSDPSFATNQL